MWPEEKNNSADTGITGGYSGGQWILGEEKLPLLIGAVTGGALLALTLITVALWRCYRLVAAPKHLDCGIDDAQEILPHPQYDPNLYHDTRRDTTVRVSATGADGLQWAYTSHVLMPAVSAPHWFYNSRIIGASEHLSTVHVPRSISVPHPSTWTTCLDGADGSCSKQQRPLSQPVVRFIPCSLYSSSCQFSSSGALAENVRRSRSASAPSASLVEEALRTRSLPGWVRSKTRPYPPLSSAEDLSQIYAEVNLSKKRRNRMRNGEAAIIALSRSRSRCHLLSLSNQAPPALSGLTPTGACGGDRASLVDHEAVLVYDERTAV